MISTTSFCCWDNSSGQSLGFTLIEILVSLAIMAIALVAVLKSTLLIQEGLLGNRQGQTMSLLGAQKLSEIEIKGFDSLYQLEGSFESHPNYIWEIETESLFETPFEKLILKIALSDSPEEEQFVLEKLILKRD